MRSFLRFLQYNNAVPIAVSFLLLGATATFAATNPEAIYAEEKVPLSVDNTFIIAADIENFNFSVQIKDVTEDAEQYYVVYTYKTISLQDYVWKETPIENTLKISKKELTGKDLGVFVSKQLTEVIKQEREYLKVVQANEKEKGESHKAVATAYSGLIGKMLDPTTEVFPGYDPVVDEAAASDDLAAANAAANAALGEALGEAGMTKPAPDGPTAEDVERMVQQRVDDILAQKEADAAAALAAAEEEPEPAEDEPTVVTPITDPTPTSTPDQTPAEETDTAAPIVTVTGGNPVHVAVGAPYTDEGAMATDNVDTTLVVKILVDGVAADNATIDTSTAGTHTILYRVTDAAGNIGEATRSVIIDAPAEPEPTPEPTPEPAPEPTPTTEPTPDPVPENPPPPDPVVAE